MHERDLQARRDAAEESFKCRNCGLTYPTDGRNEKPCADCGVLCTRATCRVYWASIDEY